MDNMDPSVQRTVEFLEIKDHIDSLRNETNGTLANFGSGFASLFERLDRLEQTVEVGLGNLYAQNDGKNSASSSTSGQISFTSFLQRMFPTDGGSMGANPEKEVESRIIQLQRERDQARANVQSLQREKEQECQTVDRFRVQQQEQIDALQKRYMASELQKQKYQESSSKLRDIIVKNSSDDSEPVDSAVTLSFGELRDLIQRIVHKHYTNMPRFRKAGNSMYDKQRKKFDGWYERDVPDSMKKYRSRAILFELLNEEILCKNWFGLDGTVEHNLARFEEDIAAIAESGDGNTADVAEWRKRTIECASWLKIECARPKAAAINIAQFMEPLLPTSSKSAAQITPPLELLMLQLCEKAHQLSLLLRRSKSRYTYENLKRGTVIDEYNISDISPQAFDGPELEEPLGATVAFTIFGALVKYPDLTPDERYVLERSHVVLRA
ncbi:MAG: hypothetical protein FRX48_05694 [Lasallia pustulata]|uniref:Uncharacterized protein n=1 Tax=Lasallia pustulata TaxID=136370 RepID=A0A5M8PMS6_9LECA|nr:MAG: hypothetical protein FRX48_05694 [Lasallia pustulata]